MDNQTIINQTIQSPELLETITPPISADSPQKYHHWRIAAVIIFFLIIGFFSFTIFWQRVTQKAISNYDECAMAKGSMLQTIRPPVCVTQDGRQFIQYTPKTFISPADDPTANWKTYTNTDNNISFQYPNVWVLHKPKGGNGADPCCSLWFTVNENLVLGVSIFENDYNNVNKKMSLIYPNGPEDIVINGFQGVHFKNNSGGEYFLNINGKALEFSYMVVGNKNYNFETTQILSTFKFVNDLASKTPSKSTIKPTATQKPPPPSNPAIDTLEYFLTQHPEKTLSPSEYPQVYINQVIETGKMYLMKWGPQSFLGYSWDDNYIYFLESNEADFDGADITKSKYYFSPGIWLKRKMLIGEELDGSENGNISTTITRSDGPHSCNTKYTSRYFMKTILESRLPSFDMGGTLGKQDVIVLRIEQGTYSEKEYYAKGWGLVEWQHCVFSGSTCDQTVRFNQVGTHTPRTIDKSGACLEELK